MSPCTISRQKEQEIGLGGWVWQSIPVIPVSTQRGRKKKKNCGFIHHFYLPLTDPGLRLPHGDPSWEKKANKSQSGKGGGVGVRKAHGMTATAEMCA